MDRAAAADRQIRCCIPYSDPARQYAKQAFLITLLNPKAIIFYMAFFPLFIDSTTHPGFPTFATMALTIALITAAYCLTLCAFANVVARQGEGSSHAGQLSITNRRHLSDWLRDPLH